MSKEVNEVYITLQGKFLLFPYVTRCFMTKISSSNFSNSSLFFSDNKVLRFAKTASAMNGFDGSSLKLYDPFALNVLNQKAYLS